MEEIPMKTFHHIIITCCILFCTATLSAQQPAVAIVGGTLVNTDGSPPLVNSVIIIEDSLITAVGKRDEVSVPDQAHIVHAEGTWIIPGLIDAHVHFFQSGGLYTRPDIIDLRDVVPYEEEELARIRDNLEDTFARYLRSGITTVVDVGGPMWNFDVRRTASERKKAPRVFIAGPLISTYQPEALTTDDPPIIEIDSPEAARELVRKQANHNPDLIKIWYIITRGRSVEDSLPIVEAVVDESRRYDIPVSVHATQLETARAAVWAGADILVHSVTDRIVDPDFVSLLRENNVIYTPTLVVFERYPQVFNQRMNFTLPELRYAHPDVIASLFHLRALPPEMLPAWIVERMSNPIPVPDDRIELRNLKTLHEGGVVIAAGTDAGNIGTPHGPSIFREFELMKKAGLSALDILTSATINGAKLVGMSDKLGSVTPGKLADLVILNSDPLEDILNTSDIRLVIINGTIFSPKELIPITPETVVQQQVNAYNARDIDAFVSFFHPDATIYRWPDRVMANGRDEISEHYGTLFSESPELHCRIINRLVRGNIVIDEEKITGILGRDSLDALVLYEIKEGLITNCWLIFDD
jgi:imidazolonepropionase-like amidohydrolase